MEINPNKISSTFFPRPGERTWAATLALEGGRRRSARRPVRPALPRPRRVRGSGDQSEDVGSRGI